jgi:4'-phosphopantetheinyl transferase
MRGTLGLEIGPNRPWQTPVGDWAMPDGRRPGLDHRAIDIWRINLRELPDRLTLLSPDEQARAQRFRYATDRSDFIAARATLRRLLGSYLKRAPEQLEFGYGPQGKPTIAGLEFNLSHAAGWALVAVSADRAVGVDLEAIRPVADLAGLTARFFNSAEHAAIEQLPLDQREAAFFRYWTCKEAYLKATGTGLGKIQTVEIQFDPAAQLVNLLDWDLLELAPGPGWVGALAAPGHHWQPSLWDWVDELLP